MELSLCMIVKDEEAVLARCLDSLMGIPDEIIIVDTGSTDGTRGIARQYTDQVYDFAWINDFSAARNFSLSKATKEYIYVADADELLDAENHARFLRLKESLPPEIEVVEIGYDNTREFATTSNFDLEYRPKLFRHLRAFQYMDPIHETLRTEPVVLRSDIVVLHRPLSDHAPRDLQRLELLTHDQGMLSPRLEMMYARELLLAGTPDDFNAARPYFERVLVTPGADGDALRRAGCVLARLAVLQGDTSLLLRVAAPLLADNPPSEICCALADHFLRERDHVQAANWYDAALHHAQPELIAAAAGRLPLEGLAQCFAAVGDDARAAQYRGQAQAWAPGNDF